ncbi:MAG TPA: DUF3667 domain-containing protein [Bryobacteraceae bacterium]|nr:DUF3667 domain-containing protein [Bryobacteraceae bacterium]
MSASTAAAVAACRNCGTKLHGRYCSQCGQKEAPPDPTMHDLAHEAVHEFIHLDGKLLATLKSLLLHPGQLTGEFLQGRRARYIGPIRLYLTFSVVFFVLAATVPKPGAGPEPGMFRISGDVNQMKGRPGQLLRRLQKANEDPHALKAAFFANASKAMFVLVPLFAAMLRLVYRRTGRHYPAFLYFAIHFHAFAFALLSLAVLTRLLPAWFPRDTANGIAFLGSFVYLFVALRRVFGGLRLRTMLRLSVFLAGYLPFLLVGIATSAVIAAFTAH